MTGAVGHPAIEKQEDDRPGRQEDAQNGRRRTASKKKPVIEYQSEPDVFTLLSPDRYVIGFINLGRLALIGEYAGLLGTNLPCGRLITSIGLYTE